METFRPERFEDPSKVPHDAYKPFGNGQRACIGQQFALQEATLVLGLVLKYFELIDNQSYELKVKETLTLKPEGFHIQVRSRQDGAALLVPAGGKTGANDSEKQEYATLSDTTGTNAHHTPLLALYGSNLGTAEGLPERWRMLRSTKGSTARWAHWTIMPEGFRRKGPSSL